MLHGQGALELGMEVDIAGVIPGRIDVGDVLGYQSLPLRRQVQGMGQAD